MMEPMQSMSCPFHCHSMANMNSLYLEDKFVVVRENPNLMEHCKNINIPFYLESSFFYRFCAISMDRNFDGYC